MTEPTKETVMDMASTHTAHLDARSIAAPNCPHCGAPITRVLDVPYGWWDWDPASSSYRLQTAATRVDVAPWVHADCMGELRRFHPQDPVVPVAAST